MLKIKNIFNLFFVLFSIKFMGQDTKSISFIENGEVEKIIIVKQSTFLEGAGIKNESKSEYFFDENGLLTKHIDSLFNTTTYYYYTKKHFCEKQITKSEDRIKYITLFENKDSLVLSKTFDSLSVLLFTSVIKLNDKDKVIYKKTAGTGGYIEIITTEYNSNMLPIKSTYWTEGLDFKTEVQYKDIIKDKKGNWTKCVYSSDMLFKEQTILTREIVYR